MCNVLPTGQQAVPWTSYRTAWPRVGPGVADPWAMGTIETRAWRRDPVHQDATLRTGDSLVVGTVLDLGAGGLFFTPEVGYLDGVITPGSRCLDTLDLGINVEVELLDQVFAGRIVWTGTSQRHEVLGLGVQFTALQFTGPDHLKLAA